MIDFDNPPVMAFDYRGTIEVYPAGLDWRWRCKSRNGQILASGEGYKRRAGALNAIDVQYSVKAAGNWDTDLTRLIVPWRVVIHDRNGDTTIGALC